MTVGITSAGQAEVMMHTQRGGGAMFLTSVRLFPRTRTTPAG